MNDLFWPKGSELFVNSLFFFVFFVSECECYECVWFFSAKPNVLQQNIRNVTVQSNSDILTMTFTLTFSIHLKCAVRRVYKVYYPCNVCVPSACILSVYIGCVSAWVASSHGALRYTHLASESVLLKLPSAWCNKSRHMFPELFRCALAYWLRDIWSYHFL